MPDYSKATIRELFTIYTDDPELPESERQKVEAEICRKQRKRQRHARLKCKEVRRYQR